VQETHKHSAGDAQSTVRETHKHSAGDAHKKPQSPTKPFKDIKRKAEPDWFQIFFSQLWENYPNKAESMNFAGRFET